jgi:hypothetical protein
VRDVLIATQTSPITVLVGSLVALRHRDEEHDTSVLPMIQCSLRDILMPSSALVA